MSDEHEPQEVFDEQLSALHDGEAAPERQGELEARARREPEVAARLAVFAQVDGALRALPERAVPEDLGLRLRARIDSEVAPDATLRANRSRRAPRRAGRRWWAGAGLAAAAALSVYWSLSPPVSRDPASPSAAILADDTFRGVNGISEEEVGIALHYDTLANLEVIEQLEMLELLDALHAPEPRG